MAPPPPARFSPDLYEFLKDLAANNERPWFHANRSRYELSVKEPALDFIEGFGPRLERISPHFEANATANGGSLFRINRDTRFGKDKTPYKTNTGLHFRHERARDAHAPGFYLHLEPRRNFFGAGLWRPETKVAYAIRERIADQPDRWTSIVSAPGFSRFTLEGDSLVRPPKGFDPEHPLIDDLKRKDFIATTTVTQKEVVAAGFMDTFEELCRTGADYVHFLCDAVGVEF
ncbi:MAG: TIGR02453 family protein [Actinomycetia bacterium]|nr:TIGR02453 family protein [Actinomycetes bacterium]MCP3909989.1 TIGR02453 family protein [Actinomycetes bacterium]MCP4084835.1 TIGR02453 family protein [Actinomycetes bacterium]